MDCDGPIYFNVMAMVVVDVVDWASPDDTPSVEALLTVFFFLV